MRSESHRTAGFSGHNLRGSRPGRLLNAHPPRQALRLVSSTYAIAPDTPTQPAYRWDGAFSEEFRIPKESGLDFWETSGVTDREDAALGDNINACTNIEQLVAVVSRDGSHMSARVAERLASSLEHRIVHSLNNRNRRALLRTPALMPIGRLLLRRIPYMTHAQLLSVLSLCASAYFCPMFTPIAIAARDAIPLHSIGAPGAAQVTPAQAVSFVLISSYLANIAAGQNREEGAHHRDAQGFRALADAFSSHAVKLLSVADGNATSAAILTLAGLEEESTARTAGRTIQLVTGAQRGAICRACEKALCRGMPRLHARDASLAIEALRRSGGSTQRCMQHAATQFLSPGVARRLPSRDLTRLLWEAQRAPFSVDPEVSAAVVHTALGTVADDTPPREVAHLASLAAREPSVDARAVLPVAEYLVRQADMCAPRDVGQIVVALLACGCVHKGALVAFDAIAMQGLTPLCIETVLEVAKCTAAPELV
jgi:hypothetical protein